jgi:hypothetical protein
MWQTAVASLVIGTSTGGTQLEEQDIALGKQQIVSLTQAPHARHVNGVSSEWCGAVRCSEFRSSDPFFEHGVKKSSNTNDPFFEHAVQKKSNSNWLEKLKESIKVEVLPKTNRGPNGAGVEKTEPHPALKLPKWDAGKSVWDGSGFAVLPTFSPSPAPTHAPTLYPTQGPTTTAPTPAFIVVDCSAEITANMPCTKCVAGTMYENSHFTLYVNVLICRREIRPELRIYSIHSVWACCAQRHTVSSVFMWSILSSWFHLLPPLPTKLSPA